MSRRWMWGILVGVAPGCVPGSAFTVLGQVQVVGDWSVPLAVGGAVDLTASRADASDPLRVSLPEPSPLEVEEVEPDRTRLRARAPGEAEVDLRLGDATGSLVITTAEVGKVGIGVYGDPLHVHGHSLVQGWGFTLMPDATLQLEAEPRLDGVVMHGVDLFDWDLPAGLATIEEEDGELNRLTLRALAPGTDTVTTHLGGAWTLDVRDPERGPPALELWVLSADGEPTRVRSLETHRQAAIAFLVARDAAGRFVVAPDAAWSEVTVSAHGGATIDDFYPGLPNMLELRLCPGVGEIELAWLGATLRVPVAIPPVDDVSPDCPDT